MPGIRRLRELAKEAGVVDITDTLSIEEVFPEVRTLSHERAPARAQGPIMKIQKLTVENRPKVYALLQLAFPYSTYEVDLVQKLHEKGKPLHEWVCLHTNKVIAFIAFSNAYHGEEVCGLHLAPMAVTPDFQRQGVGSELLRFALRQEAIKSQALFVLGEPAYFSRFGFEPCSQPVCLFDQNNAHFLSLRNTPVSSYFIGYEPEFKPVARPTVPKSRKPRRR